MIIYHKINQLQAELDQFRQDGLKICLVPTMGALHEGHMSLIKKAKKQADIVVCSIFVNPTQFNQESDLDKYPRTIGADLRLLDENDCTIVFIPPVKEIYPDKELKVLSANYGALTDTLEGEKRPGHFEGVVTIVKRLFDIVEPNSACFGLKDFQQISVIKRMVLEYSLNIEIIDCDILREPSGLAMSSRNTLLSDSARKVASVISNTLFWIEKNVKSHSFDHIQKEAMSRIASAGDFKMEYLEFVDPNSFDKKDLNTNELPVVILFAGWIDGVRLIDNIRILK